MSITDKKTPLMKQYDQIKSKYPDAMLLFRVGDFYETFGKDAIKASKILGIVLTKRSNLEADNELAGFPHHSINTYLPKLVKAGERVAICDQLEDPKATKKIVKRGVTELVTPGVTLNENILEAKNNNFLCALSFDKDCVGVSFLDVSTGEFLVGEGSVEYVDKLLQSFMPGEILVSKNKKQVYKSLFADMYHSFFMEDWVFSLDFSHETLRRHFEVNSLKGFGIETLNSGIIACGVVLYYLSETHHDRLLHVTNVSRIIDSEFLWMDRFTVRNLELYRTSNEKQMTLLDVMDKTRTAMGARLLKRRLAMPMKELSKINTSLERVGLLLEEKPLQESLKEYLTKISDLERLTSKIVAKKISPREVIYLKNSLLAISEMKSVLENSPSESFKALAKTLDSCKEVFQLIEQTLDEQAPVSLQKGEVIAKGFSKELDELKDVLHFGKERLEEMLQKEIQNTGIASLKISMNNIFGYYFEVRNTYKDKVPDNWIRKQTLVSAERYITEELKDYESKIFGAEEQITAIEHRLFEQLLNHLTPHTITFKSNAKHIAEIDLLCCFSQISATYNYVKPSVEDSDKLIIKEGRHPVIERQLPTDKAYISNDIRLDKENQQIIIVTGPNMSGKSALLRQTALIVLMAQMGCFVPAEHAMIGLVDKIFTRVGASDNISMGESTFMVEMNEAASILNNISSRSLILLDEIGRGTSTYDGISIAWAITEYLNKHSTKPKTIFATHYHELNEMASLFSNIKNYNVSVKETNQKIIFLRKLKEGGSQHSFGINVAKMAGMPRQVIESAEKILIKLEKSQRSNNLEQTLRETSQKSIQMSLFGSEPNPILEKLEKDILALNLNTMTPVEVLMKISDIQRKLAKNKD